MSSANTDVVARLQRAAAAVASADLPPDLRSAGFVLAYRSSVDVSPVDNGSPKRDSVSPDLATQLEADPQAVERIFDIEDDGVALIVPRRALSSSKSAAVPEVAHLIVAARQRLGYGEWTPSDEIRRACENLGVLDGNFGRAIQQLQGEGFRIRGAGLKREVKMNATGFEATTRLIERIATSIAS